MYKTPCALVVGIQDDGLLPKFAKVHAILVMDSKVYVHAQVLTTVEYSEHFNSYVVVAKMLYITLCHAQLLSHTPLHVRHFIGLTRVGDKAIILKHHISTP